MSQQSRLNLKALGTSVVVILFVLAGIGVLLPDKANIPSYAGTLGGYSTTSTSTTTTTTTTTVPPVSGTLAVGVYEDAASSGMWSATIQVPFVSGVTQANLSYGPVSGPVIDLPMDLSVRTMTLQGLLPSTDYLFNYRGTGSSQGGAVMVQRVAAASTGACDNCGISFSATGWGQNFATGSVTEAQVKKMCQDFFASSAGKQKMIEACRQDEDVYPYCHTEENNQKCPAPQKCKWNKTAEPTGEPLVYLEPFKYTDLMRGGCTQRVKCPCKCLP